MIPQFSFTRVPSVKVSTAIVESGLVSAANTLVLVGRIDPGGSASIGTPYQVSNYGDPVAAQAECAPLFGPNSEITGMVVAAIKGILYSDLEIKGYPPIVVVPLGVGFSSANLPGELAPLISMSAPYIAMGFDASDSVAVAALQQYAQAISGADRGDNGQFGTFAFAATRVATPQATPIGINSASQNMCFPWLIDSAATPANPTANVAAAYAAVCASLGVPFLPLNGITIGGLIPPVNPQDYHTAGDAGTVQLGLASGLVPLVVKGSSITISRAITALRTVAQVADNAYFDMQDWQVLYYYRLNAYNTASQPRYARAKATDQKLKDLRSELIEIADTFEDLEMFQYVSKFLDQFTINRPPGNRFAGVFAVPVNVVPGFMNKGIALIGTEQFDTVTIS